MSYQNFPVSRLDALMGAMEGHFTDNEAEANYGRVLYLVDKVQYHINTNMRPGKLSVWSVASLQEFTCGLCGALGNNIKMSNPPSAKARHFFKEMNSFLDDIDAMYREACADANK